MTKQWRERNREKLKADKARWYQEHKELQDARNKAWIMANPESRKEHANRYVQTHDLQHRIASARAKARHRGYEFAVSLDDVKKAHDIQDGRCAICGNREVGRYKKLALDHSHETGAFRGFLCSPCNLMLGKAGDDPARLRAGANYLETGASEYDFDGHA